MSSYVIGKKEYVKAAGIAAGMASILREFWLYNYEAGRNFTKEDYYMKFCEFYTMNALSVQMQYDDPVPECDGDSYKAEFERCYSIGRQAAMYTGSERFQKTILDLRQFFHSCIYQTEYEAYSWKMKMIFNELLVALMPYMWPGYRSDWWGSVEA